MRELARDADIIILPADKGRSTVVMDVVTTGPKYKPC